MDRDTRGEMTKVLGYAALCCALCASFASGCGDEASTESTSAASEALLEGMEFGDGMRVDGKAEPSTRSDLVIMPVSNTVIVAPGSSNVLAIEVDNPDEATDPVMMTQIELQTDKGHIVADARTKMLGGQFRMGDAGLPDAGPAPDAAAIRIDNAFAVAADVCAELCDTFHSVELHESAVLAGGAVGARSLRQLVLDCSLAGNPARCAEGDKDLRCALRYTPGDGTCEVELYFCTDGVGRAVQCDGATCDCVERFADGTTSVQAADVIADPAAHCAALDASASGSESGAMAVQLKAYDDACPGGATFK